MRVGAQPAAPGSACTPAARHTAGHPPLPLLPLAPVWCRKPALPPSRALLQLGLPWEPLLTDEEVQRAEAYYGTGARMRRVAAKLLAGQPVQVFTLGGSVTRGLGATRPDHNYANRFFQLINATFPHR